MRDALDNKVKVVLKHYHAAMSNTGARVLVLKNIAQRAAYRLSASSMPAQTMAPPRKWWG
ncbi:MAG: hypothetical protein H6987_18820, partial [Pseudomonadales bacterium]|nr:hypothetical protein [Pseudomonadales bacterium]